MTGCEISYNKLHGVQLGYTRTTLRNCMVSENMQCAIKLQSLSTKMLLRVQEVAPTDSTSRDRLVIKGKVGGEWGEIHNPFKELQGRYVNEQSDITRLLIQINAEDEASSAEVLTSGQGSPQSNKV